MLRLKNNVKSNIHFCKKIHDLIIKIISSSSTKKNIISVAFGALCVLAFEPFNFVLLAILSLTCFYLLLNDCEDNKKSFWIGWCYGFGYFLAGTYWITISLLVDAEKFMWLMPFALTLVPGYLALYFGLFAISYNFLISRTLLSNSCARAIVFAILWLVFELLRSFFLIGFPWNLIGYVWSDKLVFMQLASIFGIYGLGFVTVVICLLPAIFLTLRDGRVIRVTLEKKNIKLKLVFTLFIIAIIFTFYTYGYIRIGNKNIAQDSNVIIRLVQANITQKARPSYEEKYRDLEKQILVSSMQKESSISSDLTSANHQKPDVVIWSESSVPFAIDNNSELIPYLKKVIPEDGILITGGVRVKYDTKFNVLSNIWNSIFVLSRSSITSSYDKHHLVPFGEYVPLQKFVPFIEQITDGGMAFSKGSGPQTIQTKFFSFSPLICYEAIFSGSAIDKKNHPDLMINLTNDAWFGNSIGPYQHFAMAKMRAVEYGIPLIRAANTGISALIDPYGEVRNVIPLNQQSYQDFYLMKSIKPTIYSRFGLLPTALLVVLALLFVVLQRPPTR